MATKITPNTIYLHGGESITVSRIAEGWVYYSSALGGGSMRLEQAEKLFLEAELTPEGGPQEVALEPGETQFEILTYHEGLVTGRIIVTTQGRLLFQGDEGRLARRLLPALLDPAVLPAQEVAVKLHTTLRGLMQVRSKEDCRQLLEICSTMPATEDRDDAIRGLEVCRETWNLIELLETRVKL